MDQRDPSNIFKGVYSNHVSPLFTNDAERVPVAGHPIRHFMVKVEIPGYPAILTWMTTTARADEELVDLTIARELGLGGVLLTRQPGQLNSAAEAARALSLAREGRFLGVEVDAMEIPRQSEPFFAVAERLSKERNERAVKGEFPSTCQEVCELHPMDWSPLGSQRTSDAPQHPTGQAARSQSRTALSCLSTWAGCRSSTSPNRSFAAHRFSARWSMAATLSCPTFANAADACASNPLSASTA